MTLLLLFDYNLEEVPQQQMIGTPLHAVFTLQVLTIEFGFIFSMTVYTCLEYTGIGVPEELCKLQL